MVEPVRVGLMGTGVISDIYLTNAAKYAEIDIVACADLDVDRARQAAAKHGVARAYSPDDLLADPGVELVINLTIPRAHAEVGVATLAAGKHLYSEKPFTIEREDAARLLASAAERDLRVGSAPDTFLGGGLQTCRHLIDAGAIGQPVAATAFVTGHGPEGWHRNPAFFYQYGGGPLLDMGPYYLTALVNLMGPVRRVTGSARASFPERTIGSEPLKGQTIAVEVPTHVAAVLDFASGAIATLVTSFDVWAADLPRIEVYGATGSLSVPDPNQFGGPIRIHTAGAKDWSDAPLTFASAENSRGIGVADMAAAIRAGEPHRASGELAYHVLDIMASILDASESGRHIDIQSTCDRPAPLPEGLPDWAVRA